MIKESLYFSYGTRKSSDFGILNVSIQQGLYEESFLSNRSIREMSIRGREKPYFVEVSREPKVFQLTFAFEETWNDDLISDVKNWLDVDYYQPLFFSEDIDNVFYALCVDSSSLIHNGLKQGYITLTFRCDSPYSYGHYKTEYHDISSTTDKNKIIEIMNHGDVEIKPEIIIKMIGNGSVSIKNLSRHSPIFVIDSLQPGEQVVIDCENTIIETDLVDTERYDNFNNNYLTLFKGKNILQVYGDCKIKFQYRYQFR